MKKALFAVAVIITILGACKKDPKNNKGKISADIVISWSKFSIQTIKNKSLNTNLTTRILAIEAVAVYDAVNSILQFGSPYHYNSVNNQSASPEAAAAQAAHDVLCNYFASQTGAIDSALNESLKTIKTGNIEEGRKVGAAAALDIIALRHNDGCEPNQEYLSPSNLQAGQYRATPPYFAPGINLQWRSVKLFLLSSATMFRLQPPHSISTNE